MPVRRPGGEFLTHLLTPPPQLLSLRGILRLPIASRSQARAPSALDSYPGLTLNLGLPCSFFISKPVGS